MTTPKALEATNADYEAYQTVVQLVSKGISDGITEALTKLKDPASFGETVNALAAAQGVTASAVADPKALYNGFWTLANGVDTNFCWRSSAGVPLRSALITSAVKPTEEPVSLSGAPSPQFSIGVSAFGIGLGVSW